MDYPLADVPCHDPFVLAVPGDGSGERGYLLYTSFDARRWDQHLPPGADPAEHPVPEGTGVLAWWSTDLRRWGSPRVVFTVPAGCWADPTHAPWAPEVHAHGDRWVLSATLHRPADRLPPARQRSTSITVGGGTYPLEPVRRGTVLAVADSPLGPFSLLDPARSHTPPDFMALDGTLFVDDVSVVDDDDGSDDGAGRGAPWLVYAHEWVQILDGTVEAVPLLADLSGAAGPAVHLFRASEAPWFSAVAGTPGAVVPSAQALAPYVSDGPQLHRLPGDALAMLWSTYRSDPRFTTGEYVQTQALSPSGALTGPWVQGEVLVGGNAGHGMLLTTHEGDLVLVLHRGMNTGTVRAEVHDVEAHPDGLRVTGRRV